MIFKRKIHMRTATHGQEEYGATQSPPERHWNQPKEESWQQEKDESD